MHSVAMQESTRSEVVTLVDGSFLLYQGFYAFQHAHLVNARNEPTGATHSFLMQLDRIMRHTNPSHMAVMFDSPTASAARRENLPQYKTNRHCPDELHSQFQKGKEACDVFGFAWRESPSHEADDLIATYARKAQATNRAVRIASKDKDLLQLVSSDQVTLISVDGPRWKSTGETEVWKKWGVRPDQMGYLIAMMGDTADVIPGVPGIGPTRGAALLRRYNDLFSIVKAAKEGSLDVPGITSKLQQNIVQYGDQALDLYEKVVQLQDVPLEEDPIQKLVVPVWDDAWKSNVEKWCDMQDFKQVKKAFTIGATPREKPMGPKRQETGGIKVVSTVGESEEVLKAFRSVQNECFAVFLQAADSECRPRYLSIYAGPKLDLGGKRKVVVDFGVNEDQSLVTLWCKFLMDPTFKKVYHCFADLHRSLLLPSEPSESGGNLAAGFQADTMHMARLWDPSLDERKLLDVEDGGSYSVPGLAELLLGPTWRLQRSRIVDKEAEREEKLMQYNADCAAAIFHLHEALQELLGKQTWDTGAKAADASMMDFYAEHWQRLAKLLSDIELRGMPVNERRLAEIIQEAESAREKHRFRFCAWASASIMEKCGKEVSLDALNLNSAHQLRQLFFAKVGDEKEFCGLPLTEESPWTPCKREELLDKKKPELEALCREMGCKISGKKEELIDRLSGLEDPRPKARRRQIIIPGLGFSPTGQKTPRGEPQVTLETLQLLMKKKEELQEEGVEAIKALREWRLIESRLSGFLKPLQSASNRGRVHSQINLNTMTGRLSTRNPNLQGEPTGGDSEMFPARSILAAPPGKRLLVADYAQLELRLVAHLANCTSMIDILQSGGDIHSRTAYKMFEEVKLAVDQGLVVVDEAARDKDAHDAPLVKDHFPELRKKAKTLNFALLYGKTAYSFAIDWNIEQFEAQAVIDRWFQAFPEVKTWMDLAHSTYKGEERRTLPTLLGRCRPLRGPRHRALRVAGNTPVQGSAADVVLSAMVGVDESEVLRRLGFQTVLQIHDELVLEGPEDSAEEALNELVRIMENPLPFKLKVPLLVDACHVQSWNDAK